MIDLNSLPGLMQNIQTDPTQMQRILQALGLNTVEEVAQFGQPITAQNAAMGMPQQQPGPPLAPLPPCLLYTSPSPRDRQKSRMPSSA